MSSAGSSSKINDGLLVVAHVPVISQYLGRGKMLAAGAGGGSKQNEGVVPSHETSDFGHRQTTILRSAQSMTHSSTRGIAVLHR